MLKMNYPKTKRTKINYINYKHFDVISFKEDLKTAFSNNDIQTCRNLEKVVMIILDRHALLKKKVL